MSIITYVKYPELQACSTVLNNDRSEGIRKIKRGTDIRHEYNN